MDLSTKQKHTQRADSRWQEGGGEGLGVGADPGDFLGSGAWMGSCRVV